MKLAERIIIVSCLAGLCGFSIELGLRQAKASIDCNQVTCNDCHAWYAGKDDPKKIVLTAQQSNTGNDTTTALCSVYTATATGNCPPPEQNDGSYTQRRYNDCTFFCNQVGGIDLNPQCDVSPLGMLQSSTVQTKKHCTGL